MTRTLCALLLVVAGAACKRRAEPKPAGTCDSAAGCVAVAEAQLRTASPDPAVVISALGRACDLESGDACLRLSHFLMLRGAEREQVNGLLDRACEAGHQGTCVTVAEALLEGRRGRTRDVPRGLALLERACKGGESAACGLREAHRGAQPGPRPGEQTGPDAVEKE